MALDDRLARASQLQSLQPFQCHDCSAAFTPLLGLARERLGQLGLDEAPLYRNTTSRVEGDHYGMYTVEDTHAYALQRDGSIRYRQNDGQPTAMPFEQFIRGLRYHEAYDGWKGSERQVHERLERIVQARDPAELG
jgi:hypothetical protein